MTVSPATPECWDDLVEVFGKRGDDPEWCWCQRFLLSADGDTPASADNRAALHDQVTRAPRPPGLIAYMGGKPAGWSRIGPRKSFPGVTGNRALARVLDGDDATTWWVTCFAVARPYRRSGVASGLLRAALDFARDRGAAAVEGHPVDVRALRSERVAASSLYTGTSSLFVGAGFGEVARTHPARPVMRRVLGRRSTVPKGDG